MQNRFLNSQAINFNPVQHGATAADPSGSHIANTGGMLGNAIVQYAKDKKEKEEKKAKEEAAAQFILKSGAGKDMGITDEKSAMQAVKGVGVDNIQNFIQLQQRQKQIEQQDQQIKAEAEKLAQQNLFLQQKAAKVERDAANNQRFMGQVSGMAPNRNPAAQTPQDVMAAAARTGVDPAVAARIANTLPPSTKQGGPAEFIQDPQTGARFLRAGNSVLPSKNPTEKEKPEEVVIGETTYFKLGERYFDKKGAPVSFSTPPKSMLEQLNELKTALGVQSPEAQPPAPQGTATPEDKAAMEWLEKNKNDPNAAGVMARLRAKGLL